MQHPVVVGKYSDSHRRGWAREIPTRWKKYLIETSIVVNRVVMSRRESSENKLPRLATLISIVNTSLPRKGKIDQ
jgi:hypothetical protein